MEFKEIQERRNKILEFEKMVLDSPDADINCEKTCPVKHYFTDGMYVREIFMPKDIIVVSKIHKKKHPYFVLKGKAEVVTDENIVIIKAPYFGITESGTKRVLKILEDMVWITVHATKETDLEKIEEEIIAKNFEELENDIKKIETKKEA
jgi:hypothetical protein